MNVIGGCSLVFLILLVPTAGFGGTVGETGTLSGFGHGRERSVQDSILEQDLKLQQTANLPERPTIQTESGEATRTPLRDEGLGQEPADEMQKMNVLRPDWQRIVGKTGSATVYRRWLAKQPKAYQRMIESATTAAELNESIEEFLQSSDAHQEELDVKFAEMRARAREQGSATRIAP